MDFAAPHWLWWLGAAPAAALLAALGWRRRLQATAAWAAPGLWDRLLPTWDPRRLAMSSLTLAVALAALALALARPRWGLTEQRLERRGVDVVFVLDTSLSMATRDLEPSRLWVAQTLIRRLVRALPGHRVALVQAEGDGVARVPLTTDAAVIDLVLDTVLPGSLPTPGTELRPSLERALELFPPGRGKHRALVLVSDGEDHGSGLDRAAARLRDEGVVVHSVGVGTRAGKPLELPQPGGAGAAVRYKRDQEGNVVVSRLREETLERLARATGGIYLRATGAATDPAPLVARIEAMDRRSYGSERIQALEERFQWPAAAAVAALVLHLSISPFRRRRNPPRIPLAPLMLLGLLAATPAAGGWPPWLERWLFNPAERTERAIESQEAGAAERALEPLETALRLAGDDPVARYNAGTGRLGAGHGDPAALLESAAESGAAELVPRARYNLGNARLAGGDPEGAVEAYQHALRHDPAFDDAKYNLELALRLLEQRQRRAGGEPPSEPPPQDPSPALQPQDQTSQDPQSEDQTPHDQAPQAPQPQDQAPQDTPGPRDQGGAQREPGPPQPRDSPLPQFRDLPDMTAEEAAAILEAIENAEREQRRREALEARRDGRGRKDW